MLQAITTKYLGPTNHKGSRIKVKSYAKSITYSWDYSLDVGENHTAAANKFLKEMEWDKDTKLIGGSLPDNSGYAFVMV